MLREVKCAKEMRVLCWLFIIWFALFLSLSLFFFFYSITQTAKLKRRRWKTRSDTRRGGEFVEHSDLMPRKGHWLSSTEEHLGRKTFNFYLQLLHQLLHEMDSEQNSVTKVKKKKSSLRWWHVENTELCFSTNLRGWWWDNSWQMGH